MPCAAQLSHKSPSGQNGVNLEKGAVDTLSRSIIRSISVHPSNTHPSSAAGRAVPSFLYCSMMGPSCTTHCHAERRTVVGTLRKQKPWALCLCRNPTLRAQDWSRLRIQSLLYRSRGPLGKDYFRTTIFFPANFVTLLAVI